MEHDLLHQRKIFRAKLDAYLSGARNYASPCRWPALNEVRRRASSNKFFLHTEDTPIFFWRSKPHFMLLTWMKIIAVKYATSCYAAYQWPQLTLFAKFLLTRKKKNTKQQWLVEDSPSLRTKWYCQYFVFDLQNYRFSYWRTVNTNGALDFLESGKLSKIFLMQLPVFPPKSAWALFFSNFGLKVFRYSFRETIKITLKKIEKHLYGLRKTATLNEGARSEGRVLVGRLFKEIWYSRRRISFWNWGKTSASCHYVVFLQFH